MPYVPPTIGWAATAILSAVIVIHLTFIVLQLVNAPIPGY